MRKFDTFVGRARKLWPYLSATCRIKEKSNQNFSCTVSRQFIYSHFSKRNIAVIFSREFFLSRQFLSHFNFLILRPDAIRFSNSD